MALEHLGDLKVFVEIVDRGSLVEAARSLEFTKNTVTRRLARLEERLGKPLLLRTTRTVSITEDGRRFYDHCRRILSEVLLAEEAIVDRDTLRGTLRVGIPTRLLGQPSLSLLDTFLQHRPSLQLQIIASDQPFDVLSQRLDVAIAVGPLPDSSLLQRRITTFADLVLAAAPSYCERIGRPDELRDLKQHNCLRFQTDRPQRTWPLLDRHGRVHDTLIGGNVSSNDSRVLDTAMHAGLGIGLIARSVLQDYQASGTLEHLLPDYQFTPFQVSLVYQGQTAHRRRLDPLLEILSSIVRTAWT